MERKVTKTRLEEFRQRLYQEEKKRTTIEKYMRDIEKLKKYMGNRELTKEEMIAFKESLQESGEYKVSSMNSFLAAANHFCEVMGWQELKVKAFRIQKRTFCPEELFLTKQEYQRLVRVAMQQGNERMAFLIQTIGSTGVRIGELPFVTVASLERGMAEIYHKGKVRQIFYPRTLQKVLKQYVRKRKIKEGPVFQTASGAAVNRSNIWKEMKRLCKEARVKESKVFPHNLRHLFARCFYEIKKDIAKLADVLGHSSIDTTRIYIKTTGAEHRRQLNQMKLVLIT